MKTAKTRTASETPNIMSKSMKYEVYEEYHQLSNLSDGLDKAKTLLKETLTNSADSVQKMNCEFEIFMQNKII